MIVFGGYQWEVFLQVKMYLMVENGDCVSVGVVIFWCVFGEYFLY